MAPASHEHPRPALPAQPQKCLGLGEKGHLTKKCISYFNIYPSVSVTSMANSPARNRSYRSGPNWDRKDFSLLNAWIYSSWFSTSVSIPTTVLFGRTRPWVPKGQLKCPPSVASVRSRLVPGKCTCAVLVQLYMDRTL